ncbi:MAG: tRNA/rRNA methyltransferase [Bacteroidales bacterium]|nr:tRNA/rRNA methyltransferase [Bacteroidales bacterium]MCF8455099.1 tRNA/rRNA methyltransferase [Bacteroidales bacterium]
MKIVFILVEPAVPENVGSAARAIKTMGFSELRLINPCDHLSGPARWLAHASNDILEKAQVYTSLEQALEDIDFAIASSAKSRHVKTDNYTLDELSAIIQKKGTLIASVAIVFGREESGLTNQEIALCDIVSTIPMKNLYPSLNLAQAVMLYAYSLSEINLISSTAQENRNTATYKALLSKTEMALLELEFTPGSNIYNRIIERLAVLSEDDMHLVHSVCSKILKNGASD